MQSYGEDRFITSTVERALGVAFDAVWFAIAAGAVIGAVVLLADRALRRSVGTQTLLWTLVAGAAVPVLFFGDPRFKIALAPTLAVLAATGCWWGLRALGRRSPQESSAHG